ARRGQRADRGAAPQRGRARGSGAGQAVRGGSGPAGGPAGHRQVPAGRYRAREHGSAGPAGEVAPGDEPGSWVVVTPLLGAMTVPPVGFAAVVLDTYIGEVYAQVGDNHSEQELLL